MYRTLTENLYAGPGGGKSTNCAEVFALLKRMGWVVEMAREWIKDAVWEGRPLVQNSNAQPYIMGKQVWALQRLQGQVAVVVTDSPLLLSGCIYGGDSPGLPILARGIYDTMDNLDIYLVRTKPYEAQGRLQTEREANQLDIAVLDMLDDQGILARWVEDGPRSAATIVEFILERTENEHEPSADGGPE